jgi:hypothetical protein
MGLDMFAKLVNDRASELISAGQWDELTYEDIKDTFVDADFWYWRKHHHLHGWMQKLYASKTGFDAPDLFNLVYVELTSKDLDSLESAINGGELQPTQGFFFGNHTDYSIEDKYTDLEFIAKARKAIADGHHVVYSSWW